MPWNGPKTDARFTYIDLFAGVGGIRMPFDELGGECVFSSEWDKFACMTYEANFGESPHGDIMRIDASDIPPFDILLAGFPCQPFSTAGLQLGFNDTRGTMFFEIERILAAKRPRAFLLENVSNLKYHENGRTFSTIMWHLHKLDYHVDYRMLNARDFGLPQNRERIYIVGFDSKHFDIGDGWRFRFPKPPHTPTRVGDILEDGVDPKYTISDIAWENSRKRRDKHKRNNSGLGYRLYNPESKFTRTIVASSYDEALLEDPTGGGIPGCSRRASMPGCRDSRIHSRSRCPICRHGGSSAIQLQYPSYVR